MKLIVTIDTEVDNQWNYGELITNQNIDFRRPFQALCEKYSILPTYLITSEIAKDSNAVNFLRPLVESGKTEVGAHLHPWTTPPYFDEPGLRFNDPLRPFLSELSYDLLSVPQIKMLFNESCIYYERILGLIKSIIAFKCLCNS